MNQRVVGKINSSLMLRTNWATP